MFILNELDNIDKHRTILVLNPTISYSGYIMASGSAPIPFSHSKQPVKPGTNLLDLGGPLPNVPVRVEMDRFTPYIVLADTGVCDNLSVFPIIRKVSDAVKDTVTALSPFVP